MNLCVCWFLALALWPLGATRMESPLTISSDLDFCYEDDPTRQRYNRSPSGEMQLVVDEEEDVEVEEVSCFFYPEKMLRCTIPSQALPTGSQLSAVVNISDKEDKMTALPECSFEAVAPPEEPPGGAVCVVECRVDFIFSSVMVHLKVSERDKHTLYCQNLNFEMLEVLSPPPNISVKEMEGFLQVRWGIPYSSSTEASCFHYELEVNQQVSEVVIEGRNSEQVPLTGPCSVRMRTKMSPNCLGSTEWSTWSHAIAVPRSLDHRKYIVIASVLLGTPMIVLALLLLFRQPRVLRLLFPQIPQPSTKYKNILKTQTSFFPPVAQPVCEEEVMVVEDNSAETT